LESQGDDKKQQKAPKDRVGSLLIILIGVKWNKIKGG